MPFWSGPCRPFHHLFHALQWLLKAQAPAVQTLPILESIFAFANRLFPLPGHLMHLTSTGLSQAQTVPSVFFPAPKIPSSSSSYLIVLVYFHVCFSLYNVSKEDVASHLGIPSA